LSPAADNYAWFFTYHWFHLKFFWRSDGNFRRRTPTISRREDYAPGLDEPGPTGLSSVEDVEIDTEPLWNVFYANRFSEFTDVVSYSDEDGNLLIEIDYIGEPYEDFVAEVMDGDTEGFYARYSDCMLR
jgi:hypothetical protein